jgi:hypothetical protein
MLSSGIWHRVDLVGTNVSEEHIASIIRVKRIGSLGTLAVTSCYSDDGDDTFLRNVRSIKNHIASNPRIRYSSEKISFALVTPLDILKQFKTCGRDPYLEAK